MAKRKKSLADIERQVIRISRLADNNEKNPRFKKMDSIARRYTNNILNSSKLKTRLNKIASQYENANDVDARERLGKEYDKIWNRLENTGYSRSTYMGLAKANGVG